MKAVVGLIMGSDSDLNVMQEAISVLEAFEVGHEVEIVSAHRTPDRLFEYSRTAVERGLQLIIAGAGGAAHLPGMVASLTPLPVIGVPVATRHLAGQDSLYSIVQMPGGIPVATVAINGAKNAGLLAVRILGILDPTLQTRMVEYQTQLRDQVLTKQQTLEKLGYRDYLKRMAEEM